MRDDRRFDDDEIAEILRRAASDHERERRPETLAAGLTLAELKEIGREVGIDPARVEDAARAVTLQAVASSEPVPRLMGTPVGVSRSVPMPRAATDAEWERIVALVRSTFGAAGRVEVMGSLRSWRNGNLQVHLEPDGEGHRLRMRTLKGDATALAASGGVMTLVSAGLAAATWLTWDPANPKPLVAAFVVGALGLGQLAWVRLSLPRWAGERARQMDELAERIPRLLD